MDEVVADAAPEETSVDDGEAADATNEAESATPAPDGPEAGAEKADDTTPDPTPETTPADGTSSDDVSLCCHEDNHYEVS